MKKLIIFILVGTTIIAGCESSVHTAKIERIDSLITMLDTSLQQLETLDAKKIAEAKEKAESDLHFIQKNYPDSMGLKLAGKLGNYKINRKLLKVILENGDGLQSEMEYSIQQLKDLKHDLKADRIDSAQVQQYIRTEWEAATTLMQRYNLIAGKYQKGLERHEEYEKTADSIIQELNRRGIR